MSIVLPPLTDACAAFQRNVEQHAARPAFRIEGQDWTYAKLAARVGGLAQWLMAHAPNGGHHQRVGVYTGNALDTYAALLACLWVGAAYVPLNHKFPVQRNQAVAEEAGLALVLHARADDTLRELLAHCPQLTGVATASVADAALPPAPPFAPDRLAYLLFTSGSTGRPKGVPITHGNLGRFLTTVLGADGYALTATDRVLQMFELTFDLSVFSFLSPLCVGACVCTVAEEGISYLNIQTTLEEEACTVALLVPSVLTYLQRYFEEISLPALRLSLFCGEALPQALTAGWSQCVPNARIENVYGPTEATIFCLRYAWTAASASEAHNGVVPIGLPMPDVPVRLLREDGSLSEEEGELLLGGGQVTPGYWQNPGKNAEAFVAVDGERYYRTGDVCRRNAAGAFLYLGRTDAQVKIDGYRVELGEIEHHEREVSGAASLAVVAVQTASGSTTLHLFVQDCPLPVNDLLAALKERLPAYMQPREAHTLPALPLNANGKIDRPALRRMATENQ